MVADCQGLNSVCDMSTSSESNSNTNYTGVCVELPKEGEACITGAGYVNYQGGYSNCDYGLTCNSTTDVCIPLYTAFR
jgi:hypothetical protein